MSELTTANMTTKATVVTSQERKISVLNLGDTNVVYEGVGTVRAGVDMTQLEAKEVDINQHKIHVILPPPHVTEVFLNINDSNVVAHYKNWFGPNVESELQEKAQKEALRKITAEACANHLLESASKTAKQLVEQVLRTAQYEEIIVETQFPDSSACPSI